MTPRAWFLPVLLAVQALCALVFLSDIIASVLGLPPIPWAAREAIEIGAILGLLLGSLLGGVALRRSLSRTRDVEDRLRAASGAFNDLMMDRFDDWALTPAERDVALFVVKGCSTAEIAAMRGTSEGTVKAQTAAIYRKAGVQGRPGLLSLFIEELMQGPLEKPLAAE